MAKRKSKKKKGSPHAPNQNRDISTSEEAGDSDESEDVEEESAAEDASSKGAAGENGESQDGERSTKGKSTKPQATPPQTADSEQGSQESEKGGLIVVAVIFGIIGLAIAIQILTQ
jgi:hypothetical protein